MVNFDVTARGDAVEVIGTPPSLVGRTVEFLEQPPGSRPSPRPCHEGYGSDHTSFVQEGVPVLFLSDGDVSLIHSPADVIDRGGARGGRSHRGRGGADAAASCWRRLPEAGSEPSMAHGAHPNVRRGLPRSALAVAGCGGDDETRLSPRARPTLTDPASVPTAVPDEGREPYTA